MKAALSGVTSVRRKSHGDEDDEGRRHDAGQEHEGKSGLEQHPDVAAQVPGELGEDGRESLLAVFGRRQLNGAACAVIADPENGQRLVAFQPLDQRGNDKENDRETSAYLVILIARGSAVKVIITTTGLKVGELNKKPSATSTRPFPRVTPQAVGTWEMIRFPLKHVVNHRWLRRQSYQSERPGRALLWSPAILQNRPGVVKGYPPRRSRDGARYRVRTCDPCRVKAVLYH